MFEIVSWFSLLGIFCNSVEFKSEFLKKCRQFVVKNLKINFSTVFMVVSKNVCCLPSWSQGKARYMSCSCGNAVKGYVGSVSHPDHMVK